MKNCAFKIGPYKNLIVWQKAMDLVVAVYKITSQYPKEESYGLIFETRKSARSSPSNIAEGKRRLTPKEFCRFLNIAFASGGELETQIEMAKRLPFGKYLDFSDVDQLLFEVMKMLNKMISNRTKD
jgi:four helix bundle protein